MNHWIENVFRKQIKRLSDHVERPARVAIIFDYSDEEFNYEVHLDTCYHHEQIHCNEFHEDDIKAMVDKLIIAYDEMSREVQEIRMADYGPRLGRTLTIDATSIPYPREWDECALEPVREEVCNGRYINVQS